MNELTKREQIALAMLLSYPDLARCDSKVKLSFGKPMNPQPTRGTAITDAFDFADLFLSISKGNTEITISEMENLEARR